MKRKVLSLVLAVAVSASLGAGLGADAANAPIDPRYDLDYIRSLPETKGQWVPLDTPGPNISGPAMPGRNLPPGSPVDPRYDLDYIRSLPDTAGEWIPLDTHESPAGDTAQTPCAEMLQGAYTPDKVYADPAAGGYYYAVSRSDTIANFGGAFVNIELPTDFVNNNGGRNGYLCLGVNNDGSFLDGSLACLAYANAGLVNTGSGWYPYLDGDVVYRDQFNNGYVVPADATNVIMMLNVANANQIELYIQAYRGETATGGYFKATVDLLGWDMGNRICFFRFASLKPAEDQSHNLKDGTGMTGKFTNCQMYSHYKNYFAWGINNTSTLLMERAWIVNPAHISVAYTAYNDIFSISHR